MNEEWDPQMLGVNEGGFTRTQECNGKQFLYIMWVYKTAQRVASVMHYYNIW